MNEHETAEERARAYIDKVIKINREFGMGEDVSEDTYESAVKGSADAFKGLLTHA